MTGASHRRISGTNHALWRDDWNGATDEDHSGVPILGADCRDDYLACVERLWSIDPVRVPFVHDAPVWERPE